MSTVKTAPPSRFAYARAAWMNDTTHLIGQVMQWASQEGWDTREEDLTLTEMSIGTYSVRVLTITTPAGRLTVTPVALQTPEFDGRVDITGYPSLARMMLLRDANGDQPVWHLRTSDEVDWPQPWGQDAFKQIAKGLLRLS